jgi:hypothetical protein
MIALKAPRRLLNIEASSHVSVGFLGPRMPGKEADQLGRRVVPVEHVTSRNGAWPVSSSHRDGAGHG